MIKKFITALCLFTAAFITGAQAQDKFSVDKVVAVVGNSAILYSDLVETAEALREQRRSEGYTSDRDPMNEALETLLLQKLLYQQALIDSVELRRDESVTVEAYVQQRIAEEGSVSALEAREGKPLYEIKSDLRYKLEEQQYAQLMQMEIMSPVRITPGEVERFYRRMDKSELPIVPEQYVYSQITKYPTNTAGAKQRARERLLEMRERIINGARFDVLARMYSVDTETAVRGGEMDAVPLAGLVKPFADALEKLQVGQVSEVVETEYGFHIIQLLEKNGDLYRFRHILIRPTFSDEELRDSDLMLDSLANEIRAGSITFEKAALEYSDDKYSKQNGGIVTNHELLEFLGAGDTSYSSTKFMKEELMGDYRIISALKPGEVSNSFRSQDLMGNVLSKIIRLEQIIPPHSANLNDDYLKLEQVALADKQEQVFKKWLDKKIDAMYIRIDPEFRNGEFENRNWIK